MAPTDSSSERQQQGRESVYPVLVLVIVLAVVAGIRLRLLSTPLERDEGEYAYGGQLLLQGLPLYQNLYTMKWPGTHAVYALIMAVFGQSPSGIHGGLLIANLATSILMFVLARRMGGIWMGVGAAAAQAILSTNPILLGLAGHATHFVVLAALAGLCLILRIEASTSPARILAAGVLLGIATLMKQSGAVFGVFAAGWIAWQTWISQGRSASRLFGRLGILALGGFLPVLVASLAVAWSGGWGVFWLWTAKYARAYTAERTMVDGWTDLVFTARWTFLSASGLWILAVAGVVVSCVQTRWREYRLFCIALLMCSFLGVCPGWYFRQHYFLLMVPAVALFAGITVEAVHEAAWRKWQQKTATLVTALVMAGIISWACFQSRVTFFQKQPEEMWGSDFTPNLFAEAIPVGEFIRAHSAAGRRIAVLGSEPELYFYSHRLAATGNIYMYPLMERQPYAAQMQEAMIREIERNSPDFVVLVQDPYSWLRQPDSPTLIFQWLDRYGPSHLRLVAWVEKLANGKAAYHWSRPKGEVVTASPCWLAIYQGVASARGSLQTPASIPSGH